MVIQETLVSWPFFRLIQLCCYQNVSILDFIGAKDDGGGDDNWSCKTYSQIVTTNKPSRSCLQAGCPSCRTTISVKALKEITLSDDNISKIITVYDVTPLLSSATLGKLLTHMCLCHRAV